MNTAGARTFLYDFAGASAVAAFAAFGVSDAELRYGGDTSGANKSVPADDKFWARVSRTIVSEQQETLRNGMFQRRFVTNGTVIVQLFAPVTDSRAQLTLDNVGDLIRNDFRTHQGEECEFTTAEINDSIPAEPAWLRANVVSNYQYRQFIS